MCKHIEVFAALAAPFEDRQVRSRNQNGRQLSYITARTVVNRLDDVLGPAGWWDEYQLLGDGAIMCKLSIELPDGSVLTKCDVGGMRATATDADSKKSGASDALKRAAAKFGVGRYLYGDGMPQVIEKVWRAARRERERPAAIEHAPAVSGGAPDGPPSAPRRDAREPRDDRPAVPPKSGKALFGWIKDRDEKLGVDLLRTISDWGRERGYPARMVTWNDEQVDHAHSEALRLLNGLGADNRAEHGNVERRAGR